MRGERHRGSRATVPGLPGLAAVGLAAALVGGCGGEPPQPVARLAVSPARVVLPFARSARLSARWDMTAPLDGASGAAGAGGVRVFVHLLDGSGAVVRTFDHALPFDWRAGDTREVPVELWQSALGEPLPPGDYRLSLGLYDPADGRRWSLETAAPAVDGGEYAVAEVEVPPAAPAAEISFAGSWWPAEAGADRQVLARRWLRQAGSLLLTGLSGPSRLELSVRIPAAGEGERLVLDEGEERSWVRVTSSCAAAGATVAGAGGHAITLDLRPPGDGRCAVRFEPSFAVVNLGSLASRSAALERLTIDPAGR